MSSSRISTESPGPGVLERARKRTGLTTRELWIRYVGIGGDRAQAEVRGYLDGIDEPGRRDYNMIVLALNERFGELGLNHPVAYQPG